MKCNFTGSGLVFGNNVSNSNRRTSRTFKFNVQDFKFYSTKLKSFVKIRTTTGMTRTIEKCGGLDQFVEINKDKFKTEKFKKLKNKILS